MATTVRIVNGGVKGKKENVITITTEKKRMEILMENSKGSAPSLAKKISQELKEGKYKDSVFDITIELANSTITTSQNTRKEAMAYAKGFQDAHNNHTGVMLEITENL